jgi:hypothetical protein
MLHNFNMLHIFYFCLKLLLNNVSLLLNEDNSAIEMSEIKLCNYFYSHCCQNNIQMIKNMQKYITKKYIN